MNGTHCAEDTLFVAVLRNLQPRLQRDARTAQPSISLLTQKPFLLMIYYIPRIMRNKKDNWLIDRMAIWTKHAVNTDSDDEVFISAQTLSA